MIRTRIRSTKSARSPASCSCSNCPTAPSRCWSKGSSAHASRNIPSAAIIMKPPRILFERADEGEPEGARRRRRPRRTRRSGREDQQDQAFQGSAGEGAARTEEAAPDVADVRGSNGGAQLSRLAAVDPVEQKVQ